MKDDVAAEGSDEIAALRARAEQAEADHQRAERRLAGALELNRLILENMPGGVSHVGADGSIRYMNPKAQSLLGVSMEVLADNTVAYFAGRTFREDYSEFPVSEYPVVKCIETGEPQPPTTVGVQRPDGSLIWAVFSAVPVFEVETRRSDGAVLTFLDVTQRKLAEESLRESEDRYRRLVENAPDGIVVQHAGVILFANQAAARVYRVDTPADLVGRNVLEFIPPDSVDLVLERFRTCQQLGLAFSPVEQRLVVAGGEQVVIEVNGMPCSFQGKSCTQAILRDITQRKQAEAALRESEQRWRALATGAPNLIFTVDAAGVIQFINRGFGDWTPEQLVGQTIYDVVPGPADVVRAAVAQVFETARSAAYEASAPGPDGEQSWYTNHVGPLERDGQVVQAMVIATDITLQKQAEATLKRSNAELEVRVQERTQEYQQQNVELQGKQSFLERMLNLHERERQLISYEIHDTFVQDVVAALMFCDTVAARGAAGEFDVQSLERARGLLRGAIGEARRTISGLRPPIIDEQGIVAGIEFLISEFSQRGLEIELNAAREVPRMPSLFEGTVFRIAQEALNNLHRHSGTLRGSVQLACESNTVRLEVRDEGRGFHLQRVPQGRFGLQGMRERSRLVGGQFTIDTAPGRGTTVRLIMPIVPVDDNS